MYEIRLIALYFYVCERYEEDLRYECQRFSNNQEVAFTDQELLTVYLYAVGEEKRLQVKEVHDFARRHLASWFPHLPSYQAFNHRLNSMAMVLQRLCSTLLGHSQPPHCSARESLVDSLPILTCSGKRQGKVAPELTTKGYCSTKGLFYYGLRLHALGWRRPATLPWLEGLVVSSAAEHDLSVFKENYSAVENRTFYGDKIYHNQEWFAQYYESCHSEMLTPVRAVKAMPLALKQWNKAADDLYSRAISAIRQPIESWFNWLNEKTHIQTASKVRSTKGLLVHIFGKLAAAFLYCIFNS